MQCYDALQPTALLRLTLHSTLLSSTGTLPALQQELRRHRGRVRHHQRVRGEEGGRRGAVVGEAGALGCCGWRSWGACRVPRAAPMVLRLRSHSLQAQLFFNQAQLKPGTAGKLKAAVPQLRWGCCGAVGWQSVGAAGRRLPTRSPAGTVCQHPLPLLPGLLTLTLAPCPAQRRGDCGHAARAAAHVWAGAGAGAACLPPA